jgi:hypothetical protein
MTRKLNLERLDYRGRNGFPSDERGYVYVYREDRELPARYTGVLRAQRRTWVIQHRAASATINHIAGWQVDLLGFGWREADSKLRGTWAGSAAAASALRIRLTEQTYHEE